jgi:carbamoylphosphate synthase large subunit
MQKTILITGIGGPTPRSIAKAIRAAFPEYKLIGIDANPKALGFFMPGLVDKYYLAPKVTEPGYWPFIQNLIADASIDFAFVQPEKEVIGWGEFYNENGSFPCPVFIPPLEYANALVDKVKMSNLLKETDYIPKTISITPQNPNYDGVANEIGYPCWIRASTGSGGYGSLKLQRKEDLEAWLFIHNNVKEFTVSEYLPGRHLANQMMYIDGKCVRNAGLECVEYVMADVAPSKVTGNTSFGRFLNEKALLDFCEESMDYIAQKLGIKPHGVFSFDLKEDAEGNMKITEINVRHMAYTGIMSKIGFDLVSDTIKLLSGSFDTLNPANHQFFYDNPYIFLRDVDIEPLILDGEHHFFPKN